VDEPRLPFHIKAVYLALRLFAQRAESVGVEALELLGDYAVDEGGKRADLERRLSERRAHLDRVMESRAEEQRRREELEAEVAATRGELDRAMNSRAEEERRREEVAAELRVGRDRAMESRAKEQRRRQKLKAELDVTRAEHEGTVESLAEERRRGQ